MMGNGKETTGASTGRESETEFRDTRFGWSALSLPSASDSEDRVRVELLLNPLIDSVDEAGSRFESFDLKIDSFSDLIPSGKYEVKKLYRRNERSSFDRRFKVGARGERMYGRRDAEIKALALEIEDMLELGSFGMSNKPPYTSLEDMHSLIDMALHRRHSKEFMRRFSIAAEAFQDAWAINSARQFLEGTLQGPEIVQAFCDIEGIFLVAGDLFTLVRRDEIGTFLEFDAVSVEGVKLRYSGRIPKQNVVTKKSLA